jgi:aspartyl-tRNA(Asn)/glutamyl-tRNA(Gln) amidotransferase subunit A
LAHTVEDCILTDIALRGSSSGRTKPRSVKGLDFLVPETVVFDGCEAAVLENFEMALRRLARAGARIRRAPFPVFQSMLDAIARYGHLLGPEALHVHRERVAGPDADHMDSRVVNRLRAAAKISALDFLAILDIRARLIAESTGAMDGRVVAFPTVPHVAMEIAPLEASEDEFNRANVRTLRNTSLGNFLDWCGVALPTGTDPAGMPTSLMLSAPHGQDGQVLTAALAAEAVLNRA